MKKLAAHPNRPPLKPITFPHPSTFLGRIPLAGHRDFTTTAHIPHRSSELTSLRNNLTTFGQYQTLGRNRVSSLPPSAISRTGSSGVGCTGGFDTLYTILSLHLGYLLHVNCVYELHYVNFLVSHRTAPAQVQNHVVSYGLGCSRLG